MRAADFWFWPVSASMANGRCGSFVEERSRAFREMARQKLTDTVEKGKNEPIEIFACAPVETDFRNPMHHRDLTKAAGWKSN
jgi:hypothetical protein